MLNEEGEDLNLEGDDVALRTDKALFAIFKCNDWIHWLMNIVNQNGATTEYDSTPTSKETYKPGVESMCDPFLCREEIIISFLLSWSRKFLSDTPASPEEEVENKLRKRNLSLDAVTIACQMLMSFNFTLLWSNKSGASSINTQGSAVAHIYCDIVEVVCFHGWNEKFDAKICAKFDAVILWMLENVKSVAAPSIRIRIILILCQKWDKMQPKSKTGSTEQRQTLFINVVSSEIEALFVETEKGIRN